MKFQSTYKRLLEDLDDIFKPLSKEQMEENDKRCFFYNGEKLAVIDIVNGKKTINDGLHLYNKNITSLNFLKDIDVINGDLYLFRNKLTDLHGLENVNINGKLDLSYNNLTDLYGLENKTINGRLDLRDNKLTDLHGFENVTVNGDLILYWNNLTTLEGCKNVTCKDISLIYQRSDKIFTEDEVRKYINVTGDIYL